MREPAAGTLDALAVSYYRSEAFTALRASTQANHRRIVEQMRAKHGTKPVQLLTPEAVQLLLAEKAGRRVAMNHRLKLLKALMARAVETKTIVADPTTGLRRVKHKAREYTTWSEDEIAAYEAHWPSGTRQRLAFALLLYTAQRRSDVVRMGRQHLRGGMIEVRQIKTGAELLLPIHAELAAELRHVPAGQMVFLMTKERGGQSKPFTSDGFYNSFIGWCREAGILQVARRTAYGRRAPAA
ncbi:tyrosine-type recombinase/integrase [Siccirubricoccus deserti]